MRTLVVLALTAVALLGCNPEMSPNQAETVAALGNPGGDPTQACFIIPWPFGPQPLIDRWQGQRGFIFFHHLSVTCSIDADNDIGVVGLDPTMTQVIFVTEVANMDGVAFYRNLPGTIGCSLKQEAGQIGSQNTDTGGNHGCQDIVCIANDLISTMHATCCNPLPAKMACTKVGATCGSVDNGCGTQVECGTCQLGYTCEGGSCERNCSRTCAKGWYLDPDTCNCVKGLPK
jgi:hypothetical protein